MPHQKSVYTVKQATAIAFKEMPPVFQTLHLVALARGLMARPFCMDGTILRRLRELREEQPETYGYDVLDHEESKYRKRALKAVVNA